MMSNADLAAEFARMSQILELLGEDSFRALAHARAARVIEGHPAPLAAIANDRKALTAIDGIGPKIAEKISEACSTGKIAEFEVMRAKVPEGLLPLLDVQGLGAKTIRMFWQEGGVTDRAGLDKLIETGEILKLPRMGAKAVEKLKASLAMAAQGTGRLALGPALVVAERVAAAMRKVKGVKQSMYAGSVRRGRDTVGDVDVLVATDDPEGATKAFLALPGVTDVFASGPTRASVRMAVDVTGDFEEAPPDDTPVAGAPKEKPGKRGGGARGALQVDLKIVPLESWGAALLYFTGSKDHNVALRERALAQGMTLNEYGLYPLTEKEKSGGVEKEPPHRRGAKAVASKTEEDIYRGLGLLAPPPELREGRGEFELKSLPRLLEVADIKAELHAHTTASDGRLSIDELAAAAKARGFHTIAVTDHSQSSAFAGGLKPDRLRMHIAAVREAQKRVKGITILAGSEVDIRADGRLDYDDDLLRELDIVVASPHAALTQDSEAATKRLIAAVSHPLVHILGHPTGRLVLRRRGLEPDMAAVIEAACRHGVAMEINAHWHRLDLRDVHVKQAIDAGCLIAINCDVHYPEDFDNLRYGVLTARRGWVTPERCINAWPAEKLHAWLKQKRR